MAMLEVKDLEVYYGVIQAIKGVSFQVNQGEVIALIGANGAGKTTILHTITGLLSPKRGSVMFEGKEITKVPAHKIVSMGMAHVPEGRRVFAELSVYENLKMGAYKKKDKKYLLLILGSIFLYLLVFLTIMVVDKDINVLLYEGKNALRTFYFPVLILTFYAISCENKTFINIHF